MQLDRYAGSDDFIAAAGAFLAAREAEHNLILGITSGLQRDPDAYDGPALFATVSRDGQVVGAAIRTPPHNLVLSETDDPEVVPALVAGLQGEPLPGAVGPPEAVRALADAWTSSAGGSWAVGREERIYRLTRVVLPKRGEGAARLAVVGDRPIIARWLVEFGLEALNEADRDHIGRVMDDWERGSDRRFWLWEVAGRPVSMVGSGGETPNGIRIGPVYTPPADRGNGYASNLTAAVSQALLDEGREFCFLYTDLANPTSNKIYRAIGYEPVADALMVAFTR